jgi:hypothetical protein
MNVRDNLDKINGKEKIKSNESKNDFNVKGTLFNILIFILVCIIILMSYSLYNKITGTKINTDETENQDSVSEIIQVEVLNGCGVAGVAERFTDYLRANNCDVVSSSNYSDYNVPKTIVIDRTGNRANAKHIADLLGVKKTMSQINKEYFLDVSIIIGQDFNQLKPLR